MQNKYKTLLRHNKQRLQIGEGRLQKNSRLLSIEQQKGQGLTADLALENELMQASEPAETTLSRQQLFGWLRKSAAAQLRTQALKLELHKQEEVIEDCNDRVGEQRALCRRLKGRRERYQWLLHEEQKKANLRQLNVEENEIEEYVTCSR